MTSTFAPESHTPTISPVMVGRIGQNAGRRMPRMRPMRRVAAAISAPVAPVVTMPAISFSVRSMEIALIIELSFFRRIASVGLSSPVMTSGAWTIPILSPVYPRRSSSSCILFSSPVKISDKSSCSFSASTAPSTFAAGLLSPPKQSMISFMLYPPFDISCHSEERLWGPRKNPFFGERRSNEAIREWSRLTAPNERSS